MRMYLYVTGIDHQPFEIRRVNQLLQQFLPYALVPPAAEAAMGVLPVPVIGGQAAPRGAGAEYPEHRVDEGSVVAGDPAPNALPARQVRLQQGPDAIRYIVAAMGGKHGGSMGWRLGTCLS